MQVSIEATGSLGRRMTVAVPAERVEQEFSNRLQRLSKNLKLPGFRPGKVPMKMVEAQYGGKVMEEVAGDLIQSTFYEAVHQQGLRPAGGPKIEPKVVERGHDFEYIAVFEVYPEIQRLDVAGIELERPVCTISPEDVERTLETMRRQRPTWQEAKRAAQTGDRLIVDFKGSIDGVPFEGGEAQNFTVVLGSGKLIPGFEEGLVGAQAVETRTLSVKFPADYGHAALADKAAQFEIKVNQVLEPVTPALDEAFARQMGIAEGSLEALRLEVQQSLEREAQDRIRALLRDRIFKTLIDQNPCELPLQLVETEISRLMRLQQARSTAQGAPQPTNERTQFEESARRRVALGIILAEIIKAKGITAPSDKVRTRVTQMAAAYESPQEFINWYYAQPERLAEIESMVLEDEAVEALLQSAELKDKPVGFQELMQTI